MARPQNGRAANQLHQIFWALHERGKLLTTEKAAGELMRFLSGDLKALSGRTVKAGSETPIA